MFLFFSDFFFDPLVVQTMLFNFHSGYSGFPFDCDFLFHSIAVGKDTVCSPSSEIWLKLFCGMACALSWKTSMCNWGNAGSAVVLCSIYLIVRSIWFVIVFKSFVSQMILSGRYTIESEILKCPAIIVRVCFFLQFCQCFPNLFQCSAHIFLVVSFSELTIFKKLYVMSFVS